MKQREHTSGNSPSQLDLSLRISRAVKTQVFIIAGLLIASILTYITGTYIKLDTHVQDFLLGLSGNLVVAIIIFLFLEQGIKSLHPISEIRNLPASEFIDNMAKVKSGSRIRILETFTSLTNEHHEEFTAAVKQSIRSDTKIELLLFHPFSEGAKKRAQQLRGQTNVDEELRKNLARLFNLHSQLEQRHKNNLEVKLYTSLPSIAMYRCGDWAYVSLFPIGKRSDRCPNLKVPMNNPFGSYIDDTFDELWAGTTETPTIPIESHMLLHVDPHIPTNTSPNMGHYFAYDEVDGQVDLSKCYMVEHGHTLFFSIYEQVKEKDKVTFYVDDKKWQAIPHLLNPRETLELDEYLHAILLIERRYELSEGSFGGTPTIIRFKNIEEIIDDGS